MLVAPVALAQHANLPQAHLNLGIAHRSKGELDEALRSFRKAIALQPDYAIGHLHLALLLLLLGRFRRRRAAGAVNFTAAGTLSGTVALGAASTIQVSDSVEATISGVISGAQNLTKGGTGTGTLTLSAANTYTGTTSISVGTVAITDAKALGETADGSTRSTTTVSSGRITTHAFTSGEPSAARTTTGPSRPSATGTGPRMARNWAPWARC